MTNNLRKLQKDLCSFAKRCKNFKYTDSALITFLITGTFLSTNNSFSETEDSDLKIQRQTISTSIKGIHKNLKKTKMENDKLLKNTNLELIQLMEQGEHVVKSPWSNWQYGVNYFSNNWNRTFKGRGDKEYYRGIFTRSNNIFQRSIHTSSTHYSSLATGNDSTQASSNLNGKNVLHFGTTDLRMVEEPIVEVEVSAGVKPRQPKKMKPLTIGINHNLNFSVPELPDFEVPDEKVITGKTTPSSGDEIPNFGADVLNSKNITPRVATAPQAKDETIAPIQNTDISNGKIDITFDGKIKTVGGNKEIDEENSTIQYNTQGVNFVGKTRGVTDFTYSNHTHNSQKFKYKNYASIINYVMGHNDFSINNTKITVGGKNSALLRSAISIEGDYFSTGASAPNKITTLTIGENTKIFQKTNGSTILFNTFKGRYGNLVNKGTIEVTGKKGSAIDFLYPDNPPENLHPIVENATTGKIIGGGHLPTTEEDYLKIKRGEFVGDGGNVGLVRKIAGGNTKSGYHFIQNGIFELRGYRQFGFFTSNSQGTEIYEFNKPIKLLGKDGYGMTFYNIGKNFYTEGTIVNKGSYEIMAPRGEAGYNPNNVKKSIFRIHMSGEENTALYFAQARTNYSLDSHKNFNIDSVDIISENAKNNTLIRLERVDNFNLGGNGQYHNLLMKNEKGWKSRLITAHDSTNVKIHEKMEMGVFNSDNVIGITIQNSKRADSNLTNRGKLVMTGNISTKSINDMKPEDLTEAGKGMRGFLSNNKATLTNHGDFLFYGGHYKGYAEYYGDDPNDSTKVKFFSKYLEKGSYGMNAKYGGKIISDGVTYIRVKDKKSVGLFSSQAKDNISPEITISNAKVIAEDGAINAVANKSGIINFGDNNVLFTKKNALTFLTGYENGVADGKFNIQGNLRAEIEKDGTAFYYKLPDSGNFDFVSWYNANFSHSAGKKLNLNMREGGRVLLLANGKVNLTSLPSMDFGSGALSSLAGKLEITGSLNYIPYSLIESNLKVDRDVDLDSNTDSYNKMQITQSSIVNEKTIAGTKIEQVAIAQENGSTKNADKVSLTNKGNIQLTGDKSTGIYGKRGILLNDSTGKISVGKKSAAMYLLEDNEATTTGGKASNLGDISLGKGSIGIYYSDKDKDGNVFTGSNANTIGGVYNLKNILSSSKNTIGMYFNSDNVAATNNKKYINESAGLIQLSGEHSIGMFAEGNGNYLTENKGRIVLGNASSLINANIGIFSKNEKTLIQNSGNVTGGKNTVGLYGYQITTTNTSKITVGDSGIGVYSSKGNLDLDGDLKIGAKEAKGVYLVGNSAQNVAYKFSNVTLGDDSFGLVNIGKNKTITSTVNQVTLNNRNMFMYSEDNSGSIINYTALRSNGDQNYGIYSSGTATNYGSIDFRNGKGNVGLYSK
ncbi:autotransporter-associated N-terminal domain-containing protein [Leptotrichia trevisanii]|uniref:Apoptosis inducing membrane protein n=1 Tax=Leptotrichia trevisanii TaxID=109328 RepID=A0A510K2J5_9FUSO|nr:autotransporter-associated N-terminal domain-containing protein [Leptotrichia trevisanii]BBM45880.1 apoptosis inducing membrane protein [Leptotrichia trevisanii]